MEDNFKIHLFTDETPHGTPTEEASILTSILEAGIDYLHLRRPGASEAEIGSVLNGIPKKYHRRIVLHDFPGLAGKNNCSFQLNSRNDNVSDAEDHMWGLSRSCHSISEAMEVCQGNGYDFVTLSPIFDSISKVGYKAGFSAYAFSGIDLSKVVALGGVTLENMPSLKQYGFGGAALLGDVWRQPDGINRLLKYLHMRNFHLQFITDGKDVEETVTQAVEVLQGGGRWIQVRMKGTAKVNVAEVLNILRPICREYGATLLVDDHYDLAILCDGVHLGQEDTPVAEVRQLIPGDKIIGLTVNNRDQIIESCKALPDYYGVGPFRYTTTKKRLAPVLGLEGYRELSPLLPRPFVAIGGITSADIPSILGAGASGIAVSSVITRAPRPRSMTEELINILNSQCIRHNF